MMTSAVASEQNNRLPLCGTIFKYLPVFSLFTVAKIYHLSDVGE